MQDNQDKETSTDEVRSTREYKKCPGGGDIFRTHPDRPRGVTQPAIQCGAGLLPGAKVAGAWR